ncbi:MAG: 3-dehydroquinate synthase, partial [Spirochaetes bacterium]|nr:3-dehydroquinate synthase [Spirochaetota bacterium]
MSESLILETAGATSTLCFGSASALLGQLIAGREYIAISDQNVASLYPEYFDAQRSIILMPGEAAKTLQQVEMAYERLYALGCDRSTLLLGVGGGTVSDFTGFVAAT